MHRAGEFTVDLSLTAQSGTQFGDSKRLQVKSTAYGQLTIILTVTAGALLVVLSALRIIRRVRARTARGNADGSDGTQPPGPSGDPTPPDEPTTPADESDNTAQGTTSARERDQS